MFLHILAGETIFQQQERTLWGIESALWWAVALLVIVALTGFAAVARLTKLREVSRAILEEQQKATKMLQYLNEREYEKAKQVHGDRAPSLQQEKKPAVPEIYRID